MAEGDLDRLVMTSIADACRADPAAIDASTELREIGLDSLGLVSVAALIESVCGLGLDDDAAGELLACQTVGDLAALFRAHAARARAGPS